MRTITLVSAMLLSFTAFARESKVSQHKPLSFIENKGQITDQYNKPRKDIDVKLETPGMSVFVGDGVIHYQWYKYSDASRSPVTAFERRTEKTSRESVKVETYRMDVELVGANKNAEIVYDEQQEYYENYYFPHRADGIVANTFNRVVYRNVYPGIDWVLYSKDNQLKYDFVVHAGADPSLIKLRYNGATKLGLLNEELAATTPYGSITEGAPYSYDAVTKRPVHSAYKLEGNVLRFELQGEYKGGVIIDPTVAWGTYYGGSGSDDVQAVAADKLGNAYIGGGTQSNANIATTGTFQTTINAASNGFVAKLNIAGIRQWGTYYGNRSFWDICLDKNDNAYLIAWDTASGLATAGAHQTSPTAYDVLLVKINTIGQRLWASYYGGGGEEEFAAIFCDTAGVYIGGYTTSTSGIATAGSHLTTHAGTPPNYGFLAQFNHNGVLQWGTYYPGWIWSIAGSGDSAIYITGGTTATAGIATTGAHQSIATGAGDGFLAKFNTSGTRIWGSYYGGLLQDELFDITTDPLGNLFVAGRSRSASGIATPGSFQPTYLGSSYNGVLAKFNSSGSQLWGTYYLDDMWVMCTDSSGVLYLATHGIGAGYATPGAYQTVANTGGDAFLTLFSPGGARLYATYYGGTGTEYVGVHGLAYGGNRLYMAGWTQSPSAIATPGTHQTSHAGVSFGDGFLVQFYPDPHVYLQNMAGQLCKGDSLMIRYGVSQPFIGNNTFTIQLSNGAGGFASPTTLGTKTGILADSMKVLIPTSLPNGSGYKVRIIASNLPDTSLELPVNIANSPAKPQATTNNPVCTGDSLKLSVLNINGVTWSWTGPNGFAANAQNTNIANVTVAAAGSYIVAANLNGCYGRDTVNILVGTKPAKPVAGNNTPICAGATLNLTANSTTPGVSYSWNGPIGYNSTQQNPNIVAATPGHGGDYVVTATLFFCHSKDTTTAIVNNVSSLGAYVSPNDTFCEGTLASFVAVPFNGGTSPQFQWYKNGNQLPGATGLVYTTATAVTGDSFYCRMIANGVCVDPLELYSPGIKVEVMPVTSTPSITISSNPTIPQPGQLTAFTAIAVNGGPNPTYQWLRNGQLVIGAMAANWSASGLHPYDQISCVIFSSDVCASPKTDTSSMIVVNFPTTIKNVDGKNWQVYPNPATNELTIEGETGMQVSILNVLGQEVYNGVMSTGKDIINISQFVPGSYMLQLTGSDGSRRVVKASKQ